MKGSRSVALVPREVGAWADTTCSGTDLETRITYASAPDDGTTPAQRRIEAGLALPGVSWRVNVAGLELVFGDGTRLSGISLYGDLSSLDRAGLLVPQGSAAPVWLGFPELDLDQDDVFTVGGMLSLALDRSHGVLTARLGNPVSWFGLADGLLLGVDEAGLAAGFVFRNVRWTE